MVVTAQIALSCQHPQLASEAGCVHFVRQKIDGVVITSTQAVTDHPGLPGYCAIRGVIDPHIGFEARFPLSHWNGKYYQSGCGGYCGSVLPDKPGFSNTINEALKRGYAAMTTDAGHSGSLGDASWAKDNPVAIEMYAEGSIPLSYQAGTRMVKAYYGKSARLEYFGGCSNGGRMAAIAAQRYPRLFDGIFGGSGVINLSQNGGIYGSWVVQSNTGADGHRILTRENFAPKLPLLEQEVLAQCDASDGKRDGFISLPRRCIVDVTKLPRCTANAGNDCFTDTELKVLEKWYQGPRDSTGKQLYPGMPAGSERYWALWFLDNGDRVAPGNALGGDYAKYLGFQNPVPDDYTALDFDFDRDPPRLEASGRLLNALDPDLSAFRQAGGKYLMWHGWQDPLVLPDQSVDYYDRVLATLGGHQVVDPFFRLFMIPGMGHCWELPSAGPDRFNPIIVLENWVEKGEAPAELKVEAANPQTAATPATIVCPYPEPPIYLSSSDSTRSPHPPACLQGPGD